MSSLLERPQIAVPASLDIPGILAYSHSRVVARYAAAHSVTIEEAEKVFQETKKFLTACAVTEGQDFSPSDQQDAMWHDFILFTKDYMEFCQRYFGHYLHHVPCDGSKINSDPCPLKERALEIFGSIQAELWPGRPTEMARCCSLC